MNNPVKASLQLTKDQKINQLKQRLNDMFKQKNIDPKKGVEKAVASIEDDKKEAKDLKSEAEKQSKSKQQQQDGEEIKDKNDKTKKIKKQEKKQVVLRKVAGQVWQDKTMQDWPQNDYRIFCGNLGNQVNDEILSSVFRRYSSFRMARVVTDRRTGKNRGYGFVSFMNPNDFLNALKEMNGRHVGNRPVKLTKSNWKDRDLNSAKNEYLPSDFKKNSKKQTHKICLDYKYVSQL